MLFTVHPVKTMSHHVIDSLAQRFNHVPGVSFAARNELVAVVIDNRHARAEILLQGAQLVAFAPRDQKPVIWNSPLASFRKGISSRGGIPICWPWFGDAARNPDEVRGQLAGDGLPAHGFVRSLDWQLDAITIGDDGTTNVVLSLAVGATLHSSWPYATKLVVMHRIGATLTTEFTIESRDSRTFHFSTALHTYFAISAIDAVTIDGFDSTSYIDALDDWKIKRQSGAVVVDREVDRIYLNTPARSIVRDTGWQREIVVDAQGSRSAVVWNPWIDKSKRLSDFAADAYRDMLCIETANVVRDVVKLASGDKHVIGVTVASHPIP